MKQEKWYLTVKKADFEAIAHRFSIDPLLARLLRNRDIIGDDAIKKYLYATLDDLYAPELLKGLKEAVLLLLTKIREGKKIRVIGDYDIDGVMAAYILKKGLTKLQAQVDAVIPHRIQDGYGLNEELILAAYEDGIDTILTCDNGIAAYEQIVYAKKLGMTVIVTDHHEVPYEEDETGRQYRIPPAEAVIDPKQPDCTYPFSGICGAVVAMKLMQGLYEAAGRGSREALMEFLEMAAFATVGDVMELVDENRILVKYGLLALEHTKNAGLLALIEVCGLHEKKLSPYHVGFVLGPCLNATGRLDSAKRALMLLLSEERQEALSIATDLRHLNESRKEMTAKGIEAAEEQIQKNGLAERKILIIYLPDCHESLAGIIAGRIREKYGRPVFVLTDGETEVKGSGRSIEAYSMYEEMSRCQDLFTKYGGHKMAAGLSMKKENVEAFMERMEAGCSLKPEDFIEKIHIDAAMPFGYVTQKLIEQFSLLEPFGNQNSRPLFAQKKVKLLHYRLLGSSGRAGRYAVEDECGGRYELLYFGDQEALSTYWEQRERINVTYYPELNVFRGKTQIQFVLQNYQ